jgi:uncharacterized membrane protein YbaN (DUF454 family)
MHLHRDCSVLAPERFTNYMGWSGRAPLNCGSLKYLCGFVGRQLPSRPMSTPSTLTTCAAFSYPARRMYRVCTWITRDRWLGSTYLARWPRKLHIVPGKHRSARKIKIEQFVVVQSSKTVRYSIIQNKWHRGRR